MPANKVTGSGGYNAICDECGFKFKAVELRRRYDKAMVCKHCWEPRHPQEFIRAINDTHKLPFIRPEVAEEDIGPTLNCDTFDFVVFTTANLNALLGDDYTVYKMRVVGGGDVVVQDGAILTVECELVIE
jgi:hypothetical protein